MSENREQDRIAANEKARKERRGEIANQRSAFEYRAMEAAVNGEAVQSIARSLIAMNLRALEEQER